MVLVRHHSFASPMRYMDVIISCSSARIWATLKYYFMSQRKFSKSLPFQASPKGLGLGTHTFIGNGSEVEGVPYNTSCFINMIFPSSIGSSQCQGVLDLVCLLKIHVVVLVCASVDPPFCPLSTCDTRCLSVFLSWLVVNPWWSIDIHTVYSLWATFWNPLLKVYSDPHYNFGSPKLHLSFFFFFSF